MADDNKPPMRGLTVGAAVAIGTGIGTAIFAGSDNPVWIGVGAGIGALLGAIWKQRA
jgi:hypothetical protein